MTDETADKYELDSPDQAFVDGLRDRGLLPPAGQMREAAYKSDAIAVCRIMNFSGDSYEVKKTDLLNMRRNRMGGVRDHRGAGHRGADPVGVAVLPAVGREGHRVAGLIRER